MKRDLRRERLEKIDKPLDNKRKNKYWPTIFCLHEEIFIGVSLVTMKFSHIDGKPVYKVNRDHWQPNNSKFRDPKYAIDMSKFVVGQEVKCPNCFHLVDFRLWKSSVEPNFIPMNITNILSGEANRLA